MKINHPIQKIHDKAEAYWKKEMEQIEGRAGRIFLASMKHVATDAFIAGYMLRENELHSRSERRY